MSRDMFHGSIPEAYRKHTGSIPEPPVLERLKAQSVPAIGDASSKAHVKWEPEEAPFVLPQHQSRYKPSPSYFNAMVWFVLFVLGTPTVVWLSTKQW